jgi:hypothetical protein
MRQKSGPEKQPAEDAIRDIRPATRRPFSAEEKIRIVLEGLRGEKSIAELGCSGSGSSATAAMAGTSDAFGIRPALRCPVVRDGSGGEIGHQLYDEFGGRKLYRVNLQGMPADKAQHAGYHLWWLDAARAAPE